jgi:hypothetical protein
VKLLLSCFRNTEREAKKAGSLPKILSSAKSLPCTKELCLKVQSPGRQCVQWLACPPNRCKALSPNPSSTPMPHQKKKGKFQYPDSGHLSQSPPLGDIRGAHTVSDVISQKACSPSLKCVVTGRSGLCTDHSARAGDGGGTRQGVAGRERTQ